MKRLAVTVAVMALLVSTQAIAEARGGGHGGGSFGGGASMMSTAGGTGDMIRTRQQDRLRIHAGDSEQAGTGDMIRTRQQDRLRDPSLHTDPVTLPEAPAESVSE